MPPKHPNTARIGGPGASHENRRAPEKTKGRGAHPTAKKTTRHSGVSGGGGEPDKHHSPEAEGTSGK